MSSTSPRSAANEPATAAPSVRPIAAGTSARGDHTPTSSATVATPRATNAAWENEGTSPSQSTTAPSSAGAHIRTSRDRTTTAIAATSATTRKRA